MNQLGVEDYGLYNVVAGFVSTLGFISSTMTTSIQRFLNFEMGRGGDSAAISIYSAAIRIQSGCCILIVILAESVGIWYINNVMVIPPESLTAANWVFQFAIVSLLVSILTVPFSAFAISKEHMDLYAILSTSEAVLKVGFAFSLSLFDGMKVEIYGLLMLVLNIINFLGYYIFVKTKYPWLKFDKRYNKEHIRNILSFSCWNALNAFTTMGRVQGVNLILNYYFGVIVNAANAIVTQIYSAVQMFSINICMAFRPQLVEEYARQNFEHVKTLFYNMSKLEFAMVCAMCVPLSIEIDFLLQIWLDDNVPEYTAQLSRITLLTVLAGSLHTPITQIFYANGNVKWFNLLYCAKLLSLPIGWCGFHFGASPSFIFWSILILTTAILVISVVLMKSEFTFKIWEYLKDVICPCIAFIVFTSIPPMLYHYYVSSEAWAKFFITCGISLVSSIAGLLYIILTKSQRQEIYYKIRGLWK